MNNKFSPTGRIVKNGGPNIQTIPGTLANDIDRLKEGMFPSKTPSPQFVEMMKNIVDKL